MEVRGSSEILEASSTTAWYYIQKTFLENHIFFLSEILTRCVIFTRYMFTHLW
jgi:hypothetical protein